MVKIVARWDRCGQGELEQDLAFMTNDDVIGISADFVEELILDRNADIEERGYGEPIVLQETLWPTREYYLYYAYHPDSSYRTHDFDTREEDGELIFIPNIKCSGGGCLPAFWSEVVIFRLT